MIAYEIEDDVPLPELSRASKYPFAHMKVGQSFFVKGDADACMTVRNSAYAHAKRYGKKFSCHSEKGGVRIWRTA
jgi:hypothetical protein